MKKNVKKVIIFFLSASLFITSALHMNCIKAGAEDENVETGGYLATFIAKYEPNMGVEFAQFPSKEYTNTYRTDVLYYAISKDGKTFTPLNNDKAVMSPSGCIRMGAPFIFRKANGGYGLISPIDNNSDQVLLFDSEDLIFYENQRKVKLNNRGIKVSNPTVTYNKEKKEYQIFWEGGDRYSYLTTTKDFQSFSDPQRTDYRKEQIDAELPDYAVKNETSVFELTSDEYERLNGKFGKFHSVALDINDMTIKPGEEVTLPETVNVIYSDGSKTPMKVEWDTNGVDLKNLPLGEYKVTGTINAETDFNSPLVKYRADPYAVYDEENDVYYFTASNMNERSASGGGAYQSIILRRADSINDITNAREVEVWTDKTMPNGVRVTGWYWAPELHKIGGKWRIIAQASVTENGSSGSRQCIFTCNGDDLMDPKNWEYTGYIHNATNNQSVGAFDTTYFEYGGKSYYVTPKAAQIWITEVDPKDPLHPTGPLIRLSGADRAFETNNGSGKAGYGSVNGEPGQAIEEASSVLIHDDKIFIVYAGCTIDVMYCVCALWTYLDEDFTKPENWRKYPYPLIATQDLTKTIKKANYSATDGTNRVTGHGDSGLLPGAEGKYEGTFGPGHNSFTVDRNGNPVIVYHARDWDDSYPGATGSDKYGLVDPGRHAYVKNVVFDKDGFPVCNMSSEEYLAEELKTFNLKITVADKLPDQPVENTVITDVSETKKTDDNEKPTTIVENQNNVSTNTGVTETAKGKELKIRNLKYKILSVNADGTGTASFVKAAKKTLKKIVIPTSIKIDGKKYNVVAIGKKACFGMKKLIKVTVGKNVKKVGAKAFAKCPKLKKIVNKSKYLKKIKK